MRQLNNKHLDTIEGASALPGEIVSSQFAPSCQKDENQMHKRNTIIKEMKQNGFTAKEIFYFIKQFGIDLAYEIVISNEGGK